MIELKQVFRRFLSLSLVVMLTLTLLPKIGFTAYAAASGDLTGLSNSSIGASYTATDNGSNASWSANGNEIIGSVIGTSGMCSESHYETTLTITNNKSVAAILSFDYTIAQNSGTVQVAGTAVTAGGSYSSELAAGGSIEIYLKSGSTSAATSISLTNLNLLIDRDATITFQPSENGSFTVNGEEITEEISKTQRSTEAYTLIAAPDPDYKFMGWYNVTEEKYISADASATLNFDSDQTVTAMFAEENIPVFDVGGAKFTDLNSANSYAVTTGLSKITLVSDGTLPSGSYTISSGVTLLIPFDAAGTCYTTAPANTGNVRTAPSVYRKLTMAEGASITVDGAISVSAKHYAYGQTGAGAPDGKYGYIYMNDGSSITVNNGGAMYVYGFVSGNGTVTAKSGATVYENMQICDFRGGSATSSMNNNKQKIFPLNQYFIQNIEAKLILESGADEYVYTSIYASNTATSTAVHFIGNSGAMFSIEEGGCFSKQYLPDQDRLEINVSGNAKINNLTLTVMGISISSGNYVLPITNCMTLNVNSGTTQITQDVALLAGVRVNIANGAELQVTDGSSLYVYDEDEWTAANYASNAKFKTVLYSPTRTYTRKASDLIDACIDVNGILRADGYVYTTAGGANIISSEGTGRFIMTNGAGSETATYMYKDYTTTYDTIPITSAKLHNGSQYAGTEEEYTSTDDAEAGGTYYWSGSDSRWNQIYIGTWAVINGNTYYFDENGDIVKGIFRTVSQDGSYEAMFVFDDDTGIFLSDKNGLHNSGSDTYWIRNGEVVEETGLRRVITEGEEVNYYYFGEDFKAYKATGDTTHYIVEKNNDLDLPEGINYVFGKDGVIEHFEDTSINGIYFDENTSNYYYCVDGVIIANGLMLIDGSYYYARTSTGAFICGSSYWITVTHDLLDEGIYTFDEYGRILFPEETEPKNGIVEENGSLYYYVDGVVTGAGLIQIDGDYYYVRTSTGEVVHGRTYWITMTNDLLPSGQYTFADDGRMIDPPDPTRPEPEVKNGIVAENGSLYYYVDGVVTGAGLIQIDGDYYYVRTSTGEVVHGRTYWITMTNDLLPSGQYTFADDGRMIVK